MLYTILVLNLPDFNKTKGTLVHERELLTLLSVSFEYRLQVNSKLFIETKAKP